MIFEWDSRKAAANVSKHGVSFPEAATVFGDPLSITISDPDHSADEERCVILGLSVEQRLLVVVHTAKGERSRLISAPRVDAREKAMKKPESKGSERGEMRSEYDFSAGVRGKYAEQFRSGTKLVLLEPDVAEAFPDAKSVNEALRKLLTIAPRPNNRRRA